MTRPRPQAHADGAVGTRTRRPQTDRTRAGRGRAAKGLRERGSAAVEVTLMAPLLVLLLLFVVACGRLVQARLRLDDAAHQGARAASLARDPATATTAATATVRAALAPGGATCADVGVAVDVGAFRPGGAVTVTVTCHVAVADLTGLHLPGTAGTETASFTSPVDQFRGVTSAGTP